MRLIDELESLKTANENAQSTIAMLKEDASSTSTQLTDEISELRNAKEVAVELLNDQENKLHEAKKSNMELAEQVSSLQTANNDAVNQLALKEREITTLSGEVTKLRGCNDMLEADIASLRGNLEVDELALQDLEHQAEQAESDIIRLTKENNASTFYIQDLQSELSDVRSSREEQATALNIALSEKSNLNREYDSFKSTSHKAKEELRASIFGLEARDQQKDEQVTVLTESLTSSNDKLVDLEKAVEALSRREEFLLEHSRSLEADLAKAREDVDMSEKAFDNDRNDFCQRDVARDEEVCILEAKLSALSLDLAKARNDADTTSKSLDNQIQSSSLRDASRQQQVRQLDETIAALTSTVSTLSVDLSRSKDDAVMASKTHQEESSSFSKRESSFAEQIHELKEKVIILELDRGGTRLALENERVVALASSKSEHDAVVANLHQSKEYSARLYAEKEEFIAKSNRLEATIDKLQDKNDTLSAGLETATAKYNELTAQLESVTRENESLFSELSCTTAKYESTTAKHEASIRQNAEKNHVLKEFITSADGKIAHFTAQVHTLTNERDGLASLLKESEVNLAKAGLQLERLEEEKLSFSERDAIQAEKNQSLKKNIAQLNERIKLVQSDRDDVRKELEEKLAFIPAITDDFSKAKQDFDSERKSLMKKLNDVTSELHSAQNYAETNESKHAAKVCALIDELAISHNDIQQSRSLCADLKSKLQMAESLLDEGDAEIQSLSYDCERLVKQVNDLNIALENSEERLSLLNNQNESLTMELASAIASRDGIQSAQSVIIAQLKSRNESVEKELASLSHDNVQQEKQLNELNVLLENSDNNLAQQKEEQQMEHATIAASNNDLLREKETMSAELSSLNERVSELTQQLRLKNQELTSSQAEHGSDFERLSQKLAESNEEVRQSKFVGDELKLRVEALETLVEEANAENDSLASDCNRLNDGIGGLRLLLVNRDDALSQHTNGNEALRQHLSNTNAEIQRLSNDKEHIAKKLESSEEANTQQKKEYLSLSAELTKTTASYQQVLQEKETTVSELEADLVKSKSLCFQLESHCSSLRAKEAEKRSELQDLKKTFEDLTTGIRMAESQSSSKLKAHETRQSELLLLIASKEAEISTLSTQKRDLTSAITELTSQAKNAEAKSLRDTLSCEVNESKLITELRDLQNAVAGSKIKRDHLASELDSAKAALGAKGSELVHAIQEKKNLSKELESSAKESNLKEAELTTKENQLTMKVRDQERGLKRAEAHHTELVAKLEAVSSEYGCVKNELRLAKESVVTLQSENENLEEKLNDAHTLYEAEREHLEEEIAASQLAMLGHKENKAMLSSEFQLLQRNMSAVKQRESELRDQLEQATDALSNICEETQDLTAERSKFEDLSKVLSTKNKSLQLQLTDQISSSEVRINDLTKHLAHAEANLGSLTGEIHAAEQRETYLSLKVQEVEVLSSERQIEINKITNELRLLVTAHEEVMSDMTGELDVFKINSEKLQSKAKEDMILHASLTKICKGKEEAIVCLQDDLELSRKEIAQIKLNAVDEEQQLLTRINDHQATLDSQCLTLSEEKSVLAMKAERAIQAETILRSQLDSTCEKLSHLSTEVVHMQHDSASAIAEAKRVAEESVNQVVNTFQVKKGELVRDLKALNNELLKQKQRFDSELLKNDEKIQSMESCQASEMASLQQEMSNIEQARIDLFSKNIEMQSHIQQQKETNECQADAWHSELNEANKKLDLVTIELEHTNSSYEHQIQSLQDEISEKRLLNKSLSARLQVASILERRDGKFDGMISTVSRLHDACDQSRGQQSEIEALKKKLMLREKSIDHLLIDLSLSRDEIISLSAEIACAKEIGLCRAFAAREETRKELDSLTEEWRNFHKCLQTLVSCMRHDQAALPLEEALPEMTSLLNTLFDLFQMKVDEVSALQQKMRDFETAKEDRTSDLACLVGSIG